MKNDGATIAYGDPNYKHKDPALANGNFLEPMVIENIDTDSPTWNEEFFGPCFNLFKA